MFSAPQVNIYSEDVESAVEFYRRVGFEETFRTPQRGPPIHVELGLDGFTVAAPDSNPIELVQRLA